MKVVQHPQAAWRVLEGHAFVVPPGATGVVELDEVGTFIWQLIESERSLEDLVERICIEFEVEPDNARMDCVAFVEDLGSRGLLAIREEGPVSEPGERAE